MSEKQFSVRLRSECDGVVYSFFDGDKPIDVDMIVDLLNELAEENEKLRFLININSVSERRKLERQVDEQQSIIEAKDSLLSILSKENEELRKENKDLNDIEWEKFKKKYHLE